MEELDLILQSYRELYPNIKLNKVYFFFDEIQNIPGWEKFVRRLHESYHCHIIVSGSNANLLSREIASSLRGRALSFEIYPFSFSEWVKYHQLEINFHHPRLQS